MKRCLRAKRVRGQARRTLTLLAALLVVLSLTAHTAFAQAFGVSGTVYDAATDTPLPGANVLVKGTQIGTTTNEAGNYALEAPSAQDTLVFSFVGFERQEVPIAGRSEIDVRLASETVIGEEVVVVGYGTQLKRDLTGSVSSVSAEEIAELPTSSVQDALQGKVAGVSVTPTTGRPGDQPIVRIRGVGTLNNASPLYVVDGMLLDDVAFLDPRNVESVDVLKDASATAIYGSRGANGVIVVTTKRGVPGRSRVTARSYYGAQSVSDRVDIVNARQFAILANESAENRGAAPVFENPEQFDEGFNWQDWMFRDGAPIQSHTVTARGGSEAMTYLVSGNVFDQQGIVRRSDYQRINLRVNNQYFLSDHVDVGHNFNFAYEDFQQEADGVGTVGLINYTLQADPTTEPLDDDGDFMDTSLNGGRINPAAEVAYNHNANNAFRTTGNAYLNVDLLEAFTFRSTFGLDWRRGERRLFVPEYFVTPIQNVQQSRLTRSRNGHTNWLNENTLNYQAEIGDHRLDVLGGITLQEFSSENLGATRLNIPADALDPAEELLFLSSGESEGQSNFNSSFSWAMISYLSRVNYTFMDRYLLTGTFRRDGSSRFASRHRWGNFPSIAAGWVTSNEPFFDGIPLVSYLKIRGSWGRIGNDKIATDAAVPTVTSNLNAVFGENQDIHAGSAVTELGNPDLRWEETEQVDVGLELGFFDDRFLTELDWYRRETSDILVRIPIPSLTGVPTAPIVNAASVVNRGIELTMNWQDAIGDFRYEVGLNGTTVDNEVLSLGGGQEEIRAGGVRNLGQTTITIPGEDIGAFYGWKQIGVFQDQEEIENSPTRGGEVPGDVKIADINNDGVINDEDQTILGSPIPDVFFGLNLFAAYKGIDLSLFIDGQAGNKVLYARTADRGYQLFNYDTFFLDRWTGPGTSNSEPRITEAGHNFEVLDRFLYDGDFLRLRNVQLGYTIPQRTVSRVNVSSLRVYVSATDVFTFSDYPGYNPQIAGGSVIDSGIDHGTYPVTSRYTIGLELNF